MEPSPVCFLSKPLPLALLLRKQQKIEKLSEEPEALNEKISANKEIEN